MPFGFAIQVRPHQLDIRSIIFVVDSADSGRLRVGEFKFKSAVLFLVLPLPLLLLILCI